MSLAKQKISTSQLTIGMYVCQLDRPWLDTPFPFQGFYLRTWNEIKEVQRFCSYVYVDVEKGVSPKPIKEEKPASANSKKDRASSIVTRADLKRIVINPTRYGEPKKSFDRELAEAVPLFSELASVVEEVGFNLRVGKRIDIKKTKKAARVMVESVIRNPNALVWLSRLKEKGEYTYNHSLRSAVLAIVFGRHIGLDEHSLTELATGVIFADIGKTQIKRRLLEKSETLTNAEKRLLRSHVELGVEILASAEGVDHTTLVIVETHHERYDGSGYPYGLAGNEIPYFGQIAGLVDTFDAMTSKRPYAVQKTPAQVMDWLYQQRGHLFDSELIDNFIQAIGLYPAGTVVELTDGSVALVLSHNREKRLRPEVLLLKDAKKQPLENPKTIDLSKKPLFSKKERPMVGKALLPEQVGLDANRIAEQLAANKTFARGLLAKVS
jgi:HD-GYP domain-containing protein (c-di-GMP phosphodiesterase class II)